jgi:sarcosine oxidase subunit gamma
MVEPAAMKVSAVSAYTFLRMKTWLPEVIAGSLPVMLLGTAAPSQVGGVLAASTSTRVLCLAPGEWLIVSREKASILHQKLEPESAKFGLTRLELTDGIGTLELQGPAARDVLSKGCGLDLHPRTFPPGRCTRTRFAQLPVVIESLDQPPRYELLVARSYSTWLADWLADASQNL